MHFLCTRSDKGAPCLDRNVVAQRTIRSAGYRKLEGTSSGFASYQRDDKQPNNHPSAADN